MAVLRRRRGSRGRQWMPSLLLYLSAVSSGFYLAPVLRSTRSPRPSPRGGGAPPAADAAGGGALQRRAPRSGIRRSAVPSEVAIDGVPGDFDRRDALDATLRELRRQIPVLLMEPLTREQARLAYTEDTRLTAGDTDDDEVELAASLEELLALSNTFLLAVTASTRAGNLLSALVPVAPGADTAGGGSGRFTPCVESRVVLNPANLSTVAVEWETTFFALDTGGSGTASQLIGYSELEIDPVSSKIARHRLRRLQWNGRTQDTGTIGSSLAALRRSVRSLQESPLARLVGASPVGGVLEQVREGVLQQLTAADGAGAVPVAPVFVRTGSLLDAPSGLCPLEEYTSRTHEQSAPNATVIPLPGSNEWSRYATTVALIRAFASQTIPALSQSQSRVLAGVFSADAALVTMDGSVLLRGAAPLAEFYRSLTAWRERTRMVWALEAIRMLDWRDEPTIRVDYRAESTAPMVTPGVTICGSDIFTLTPFSDGSSSTVRIHEIRQTRLVIGDAVQSPQEAALFFGSLSTAIRSGRVGDDLYDRLWNDFLRPLTIGVDPISDTHAIDSGNMTVRRTDVAAATVYRLMEALLTECPLLVDKSVSLYRPPGSDYISADIQLQGYLGETLLRGSSSYERLFGFTTASLKGTLRAGQLISEKDPEVRVELNAKRNVVLSLTLFLLAPSPVGLSRLIPSASVPNNGIPLKLRLVSEYILNQETGMVEQHRLLESRVNGQLTPGDIVSRWIQRQRGVKSTEFENDAESFVRGILETVNWARSLGDGDSKK